MLDPLTTVLYTNLCRYNSSEPNRDRQIASNKVFEISLFLLVVSSGSQRLFASEDWVASLQMLLNMQTLISFFVLQLSPKRIFHWETHRLFASYN